MGSIIPLAGGVSGARRPHGRYVPPDETRRAVGERLRWLIRRHGMTQAEACAQWAMEYTVLLKYCNGVVSPSYKTLLILLHWGVSIDWLLTGVGSPYTSMAEGQRKARLALHDEPMPPLTTPVTSVMDLRP